MLMLERRKEECGWKQRRKEILILKVCAPCAHKICPQLLETWYIAVKLVVRLSKQGEKENKTL